MGGDPDRGPRMVDALRRAALRRDGRELQVLVSLAVVSGRDALPLLDTLRPLRMRRYDFRRGAELERLDWVRRELRAGRSVESLARPPDEIALH